MKGKTEPETIYALLGRQEIPNDPRFQELRKLWSTMIYCYRSRDWEGALEAIQLCRSAEHNFGLGNLFDLYWKRIRASEKVLPGGLDGNFCGGNEVRLCAAACAGSSKYRSGTLITSPGKIGTDADMG